MAAIHGSQGVREQQLRAALHTRGVTLVATGVPVSGWTEIQADDLDMTSVAQHMKNDCATGNTNHALFYSLTPTRVSYVPVIIKEMPYE
jgi:hypothetical protein